KDEEGVSTATKMSLYLLTDQPRLVASMTAKSSEEKLLKASGLFRLEKFEEALQLSRESSLEMKEARLLEAHIQYTLGNSQGLRKALFDYRPESLPERFYLIRLYLMDKDIQMVNSLLKVYTTRDPERWMVALLSSLHQKDPSRMLDALESFSRGDPRILWRNPPAYSYIIPLDRAALKKAIELRMQKGYARSLGYWALGDRLSYELLQEELISAPICVAQAQHALERGELDFAKDKITCALRFHSTQPFYTMLSTILNQKRGINEDERMENQIYLAEERSILSWAATTLKDRERITEIWSRIDKSDKEPPYVTQKWRSIRWKK
ncbi:MAG: hypothetical protein VX278_23675, partial [Myxococcota bacterium]|nr:hypothetical protein [Myxococcota bacterium]